MRSMFSNILPQQSGEKGIDEDMDIHYCKKSSMLGPSGRKWCLPKLQFWEIEELVVLEDTEEGQY